MALLENCHGGDDRLSSEGEEPKGCQERLLQLWIILQLEVLERSDTQWNLLLPLPEVEAERERGCGGGNYDVSLTEPQPRPGAVGQQLTYPEERELEISSFTRRE